MPAMPATFVVTGLDVANVTDFGAFPTRRALADAIPSPAMEKRLTGLEIRPVP